MPSQPKGHLERWRQEAQEAIDHFSWYCDVGGQPTFLQLRAAVDAMVEDQVPPDALVSISGPRVYANWRRDVT